MSYCLFLLSPTLPPRGSDSTGGEKGQRVDKNRQPVVFVDNVSGAPVYPLGGECRKLVFFFPWRGGSSSSTA